MDALLDMLFPVVSACFLLFLVVFCCFLLFLVGFAVIHHPMTFKRDASLLEGARMDIDDLLVDAKIPFIGFSRTAVELLP